MPGPDGTSFPAVLPTQPAPRADDVDLAQAGESTVPLAVVTPSPELPARGRRVVWFSN